MAIEDPFLDGEAWGLPQVRSCDGLTKVGRANAIRRDVNPAASAIAASRVARRAVDPWERVVDLKGLYGASTNKILVQQLAVACLMDVDECLCCLESRDFLGALPWLSAAYMRHFEYHAMACKEQF